jgi:diaminohydroxyphosphoribosylaminopyrimidine deaminase/5-amino-6-(5-phosphoribosylamino)uracil reductase
MTDQEWMRRCIALARRAEGRTAPNPMVGCVIVGEDGKIKAQAYHERAGQSHAEFAALEKLDLRAPGCTMYVNLEPCMHQGRTGPCAPVIASAGIVRLVVGALDPIEDHGGGADWLGKRGLEVTTGVLEDECLEVNRAFYTWARRARPLFIVKTAITADGKIATRGGDSQWITGERARADGHRYRDRLDAIMVGIGTVTADDPQLTTRGIENGRDPIRVVVDSRLRTPNDAKLLPNSSESDARVIIATTEAAPEAREAQLEQQGAEIWRLPADDRQRVDVRELSAMLAAEGILSVLVEGGPELHASLLAAGVIDELMVYIAPILVGGRGDSPAWLGGSGVIEIQEAWQFEFHGEPKRLGRDLRLRLRPQRETTPK